NNSAAWRPWWRPRTPWRARCARATKSKSASCSKGWRRTRPMADADANRGLVVSRSLLAAAAGILPGPGMDDVVAPFLRGRMLRRIADARQVDVSRDALAILADEPQVSRLRHMALTGLTLIALRKAWRKMFLLLAIGRRGAEFAHSFELGTLFDHYCT